MKKALGRWQMPKIMFFESIKFPSEKMMFFVQKNIRLENIGSRSRSWSRIFNVSVSEGVVSVSNGQVTVSDDEGSVSVSNDEAETPSLMLAYHNIKPFSTIGNRHSYSIQVNNHNVGCDQVHNQTSKISNLKSYTHWQFDIITDN